MANDLPERRAQPRHPPEQQLTERLEAQELRWQAAIKAAEERIMHEVRGVETHVTEIGATQMMAHSTLTETVNGVGLQVATLAKGFDDHAAYVRQARERDAAQAEREKETAIEAAIEARYAKRDADAIAKNQKDVERKARARNSIAFRVMGSIFAADTALGIAIYQAFQGNTVPTIKITGIAVFVGLALIALIALFRYDSRVGPG